MENQKLIHLKVNWIFKLFLYVILCSCKSGSKVNLLDKPKEKIIEANTPLVYNSSVYILDDIKVFHCTGYELEITSKIIVDSNINFPYYFMNGNRNVIDQIVVLKGQKDTFSFSIKELNFNTESKMNLTVNNLKKVYQLPYMVIYLVEYNKSELRPTKLYFTSLSNLSSDIIYVTTNGFIKKQLSDEFKKSLKGTWTNEFELFNWGHQEVGGNKVQK